MLCIEFVVPLRGPSVEEEMVGAARMRIVRIPSRERKRIVERRSSSWMFARPKMEGLTRRTRSWLRRKVRARAEIWRRIRVEAEAG